MKNKKLKILVIATIVIQLLLPSGLLYHHYSLHRKAMSESPEFKFRAECVNLYQSSKYGKQLDFEIANIYDFYQDDIAVTVGDDGFAKMSLVENKWRNKYWFSFGYYCGRNFYYYDEGEFSYEEGVDVAELHHAIYTKYGLDVSKDDGFYITAKVYKGVIIPTALYIEDQKVVNFNQGK